MKKRLIKILAALAMVLGLGVGMAPTAQAATYLGGISVEAACDAQRGGYTYAVLAVRNAHGWRCRLYLGGHITDFHVDMSMECRRVHAGNVYAAYTDYANPYSWGCYRH